MALITEINGQKLDVDWGLLELDRLDYEDSLYAFIQAAWKFIDPAPFVGGWAIEAICEHLEAVCDGEIKRLLINIPPRMSKSSVTSVAFPAWVWAQRHESPTSGPRVPFLHASYGYDLAIRDSVKCRRLLRSTWYTRLWGERFQIVKEQDQKARFRNSVDGERLITAIGSRITGEGGQIIVVDDPNAANEVLSEATIKTTNEEWWDGAMPTRLNDPQTGAFVVIQQRLGEEDLTGHIQRKDLGIGEWTQLILPMHYDPQRAADLYPNQIGWSDPRTVEGELLAPDRMPEDIVAKLERALRSWRCNPGEAPILMADLTQKPIRDIKVGDRIIGFDRRQRSDDRYGRHKLAITEVTEIHTRIAPVSKITLEGGEQIRSTPDHRWYMKWRGPARDMYGPILFKKERRSSLARVCSPHAPVLSLEDAHDAGWLAGFFDGEGSVSLGRKQDSSGDEYAPSAIISFYQGSGRNAPLCAKLERLLNKFGFQWTVSEDERKANKSAACYGYRCYRIARANLDTLRRFLHIVQPTKWRERIIESALKANFVQRREKVLGMQPDGEEVVYGLTTKTGNYIVWGLASSNSAGQLEQRPEPQGGGIIMRNDWQLWPPEGEKKDKQGRILNPADYPPIDYVLASLDTAYTENTMNDPSAMTVWGIFSGDPVAQDVKVTPQDTMRVYGKASPRVILMDAWSEHLDFRALLLKVAQTCARWKIDKLIIENKAAGHSIGQEIRRLMTEGTIQDPSMADLFKRTYAIQLLDPKAIDKVARLYSVQHIFEDKLIFAPERPWSELVIDQCAVFPNAKHDDLCDTVSMGLRHLRDIGMLERGLEITAALNDELRYKGRPPPKLYPG